MELFLWEKLTVTDNFYSLQRVTVIKGILQDKSLNGFHVIQTVSRILILFRIQDFTRQYPSSDHKDWTRPRQKPLRAVESET